MLKVLMILFCLAGLTMNGQTMQDVENGYGRLPAELLPVAVAIFPACPTEDSSWCVWDSPNRGNGRGDSFVSLGDYGIIFR